jgi:hypothetical protein
MKKKLHEKIESRKQEILEHAKGREVPDTKFGDVKSRKERMTKHKKGIIGKVLNRFK